MLGEPGGHYSDRRRGGSDLRVVAAAAHAERVAPAGVIRCGGRLGGAARRRNGWLVRHRRTRQLSGVGRRRDFSFVIVCGAFPPPEEPLSVVVSA